MDEYIKICPKCKSHNPEDALLCGNKECSEFLRNVPSVPAPGSAAGRDTKAHASVSSEDRVQEPSKKGEKVTQRLIRKVMYLECLTTSKKFQIESGNIVGQAHPTSSAQVQITDIPNINYVSREHCRFDCENGHWFVTAIRTATNPTYLNQVELKPGEKVTAKNGDRLLMANVPFQVRIIEA